MPVRRKRVFIYGNCQGGWYSAILRDRPSIASDYDIVYLANFGAIPQDHPFNDSAFLASCDLVFWQTAHGCAPPAFVPEIPNRVKQYRFPTLSFKPFWPLHTADPRNAPEPGFPYGRFSYGDRLLIKFLNEGTSVNDLYRRYVDTDVNKLVRLDRLAEFAWTELKSNDKNSDFSVTPIIEKSFRSERLFQTINHPAFPSLYPLYQQIENLLIDPTLTSSYPLQDDHFDTFSEVQIPLHPQVLTHFGVTWASATTKWRYYSELLSLEEYVRAYGEFRAIPDGNPPQLRLARAREFSLQGDLDSARRVLLSAAHHYPALPQFLQYLGTLLVRAKKWDQAEQVLRHGILRHPTVFAFHRDLGKLLFERNRLQEAEEALSIWLTAEPGNPEAKSLLTNVRQRESAR